MPDKATLDMLQQRMADPRNDRMSDKYDPAFAEETDRQYKLAYPPEQDRQ